MKCCNCQKEIKEDEPLFSASSYKGKVSPGTQYRCGWWDFCVECWTKIMENVKPQNPFPKFEEYYNPNYDPMKCYKDLINYLGEKIALEIDNEIINDLLTNENIQKNKELTKEFIEDHQMNQELTKKHSIQFNSLLKDTIKSNPNLVTTFNTKGEYISTNTSIPYCEECEYPDIECNECKYMIEDERNPNNAV